MPSEIRGSERPRDLDSGSDLLSDLGEVTAPFWDSVFPPCVKSSQTF